MAISKLPLSYCANVHAGQSYAELLDALERYSIPLAERLQMPLAVGLWLPAAVVREMVLKPDLVEDLAVFLQRNRLQCHTLNAFPYGDFHAERVKEQVYLPDWASASRVIYTRQCAEILERLLPAGGIGSISTSPLAFKRLHPTVEGLERYFDSLIGVARQLAEMKLRTGKSIRLAIEPEPCCLLETTTETIAFFNRLRDLAEMENALLEVDAHLGVCFDVCHQAVEFESPRASIKALLAAGVTIAKVHITNALELVDAADAVAREALARFVEPRYLHQTMARHPDGRLLSLEDLSVEHARTPPREWLDAKTWRVHFHVPVDRDSLGPLRTTKPALAEALATIAELPYEPHLEVETYTWSVLAESKNSNFNLVAGLEAELNAAAAMLAE